MKKILLVEDESSVVSFVLKGLSENGYEVSVALDGNQGLQMAQTNVFDLIILDIMIPGKTGLEVCREIRKQNSKVAILMLTALGTAENVVVGLDAGADDYLVKPFKFIELLARIKTLLRRSENSQVAESAPSNIFAFSNVEVNDDTKTVKRAGTSLTFTSTEYRLLLMFIRNARKVLSRVEILEEVWGVNFDMNTNVVDVYVNYLRKKLEFGEEPRLIHTVIGMGYVMKDE
jgi:two-component system, OmpR family, copper resistance phosphate regulon response regulator CusR